MQIVLIPFFLLLFGCSAENHNYEPVMVGKRYVLEEWPDSHYIHSLDSIIKAEPLKKDGQNSEKTEIVLKSFQPPKVISAPSKKEASTPASTTTSSNTTKKTESFPNRFTQALEKWQSDPSNTSLYVSVIAQENEDLFQLIARFYKKNTNVLPRFYITSALQSLNPGVAVEKIKAGDSIRLPRLK